MSGASAIFDIPGPRGRRLIVVLTTLSVPTSGTGRVAGHDIVREPIQVRRSMGLTGQAAHRRRDRCQR